MTISRNVLRRCLALASVVALLPLAMAGPVAAVSPPGECPTVMKVANVTTGMTGTGWTVPQGATPQQFNVEILGVIKDGIAPGRDLIVIEASDAPPNDFISEVGGIWSGMSGSPVYVNGKLLGAVAYGFSPGTSPVGGVTPAEKMVKILDYGTAAADVRMAERVRVPDALRATITARSGLAEAQTGSLSRLPLPMAFSGVPARARDVLQEHLQRLGVNAILTSGGRAAKPKLSATTQPVPGGNFAAMLAYGDVTGGGIGTTTYVCGDQALAFGHPMQFRGNAAYGANDASAVTIFSDPVWGSFKIANVTDFFGTVDQDRLLGIRGQLGEMPNLVPITSRATSYDTGRTRNGGSQATMDEFVPDVGLFHLLTNLDVVADRGASPGSSETRWTVSGRRENGDPWSYTNSNRYTSAYDITWDTSFPLYNELWAIQSNPFEDISFTSIEIRAWVENAVKQYVIEQVKVSKNGGQFKSVDFMNVHPGDTLTVRAKLREYPLGALVTKDLTLTVPGDAEGEGVLSVLGGGSENLDYCAFSPDTSCPSGFLAQLAAIDGLTRADTVNAHLQLFGFAGPGTTVSSSVSTDRTTYGAFEIYVTVMP